jgi:cyclophilin family peptidyl-prolyl cis-trans isomerase
MFYLKTNRMGMIVVELYWQHAPETCRNFAELARRGYYNGEYKYDLRSFEQGSNLENKLRL